MKSANISGAAAPNPIMVPGFVHKKGAHCATAALSDVFRYHGLDISEPMLFGLGSGLGFIYWKSKGMHFPFVGGRAKEMEKGVCENLGIKMTVNRTESRASAWNALRNMIEAKEPAMIYADMFYLEYFDQFMGHFGQHCIAVAGYDDKYAYVADNNFDGLVHCSLASLAEARASGCKFMAPENALFKFKFPEKTKPMPAAVRDAIRKTCDEMLSPPIKNLGVKGIRIFAEKLPEWLEYKDFGYNMRLTHIYLEKDGTGGSAFRNLYTSFLMEASQYLPELKIFANGIAGIARRWTDAANMLLIAGRDMSQAKAILEGAQSKLFELTDAEQEIFTGLKGLLK